MLKLKKNNDTFRNCPRRIYLSQLLLESTDSLVKENNKYENNIGSNNITTKCEAETEKKGDEAEDCFDTK